MYIKLHVDQTTCISNHMYIQLQNIVQTHYTKLKQKHYFKTRTCHKKIKVLHLIQDYQSFLVHVNVNNKNQQLNQPDLPFFLSKQFYMYHKQFESNNKTLIFQIYKD